MFDIVYFSKTKKAKITGIVLLGALLVFLCNCDKKVDMRPSTLLEDYDSLKPWPADTSFSSKDWENYIRVARRVQSTEPNEIKKSIYSFLTSQGIPDDTIEENYTKIFLLLRVVFDLPEDAPEETLRSFVGWSNWSEAVIGEKRINLSWPISWAWPKPKLVSGCFGREGVPYFAVEEYEYLLNTFPYRKLIP